MNDLERVTARAVDVCKQVNPNYISPLNSQGDYITMTPKELLAFEQATLKEANIEIERLKDSEESNKAVELSLEDVPYKGSYADGIEYLKARVAKLEDALALIRDPHTDHPLFALTDLPLELCYEAIAAEALRGDSK